MYKKVFCTCKVTFFANQTSCCFFNVLRCCLRRVALHKVPYITKLRVQFACVQSGFIFGKIVNYIRFLQFKENFKKIFGEFGKIHIVGAVHRCLPVCAATLLQSILYSFYTALHFSLNVYASLQLQFSHFPCLQMIVQERTYSKTSTTTSLRKKPTFRDATNGFPAK